MRDKADSILRVMRAHTFKTLEELRMYCNMSHDEDTFYTLILYMEESNLIYASGSDYGPTVEMVN